MPYFFVMRQSFFFSQKQFQRSRSILLDGSRYLGMFWRRKTHFIAQLHKTDLLSSLCSDLSVPLCRTFTEIFTICFCCHVILYILFVVMTMYVYKLFLASMNICPNKHTPWVFLRHMIINAHALSVYLFVC